MLLPRRSTVWVMVTLLFTLSAHLSPAEGGNPMPAIHIVHALVTNQAMNYGIVIGGALMLVCDIWLLLLHEPRE